MLFICGITLLIGTKKTIVFFFKRGKWRGTICFFGGILLVLVGWAVTGMLIELFGIINLFGYVSLFLVFTAFLFSLFCSLFLYAVYQYISLPLITKQLQNPPVFP